jgi:ATP-dependent Clp protease ATP-binding subunit ClpC
MSNETTSSWFDWAAKHLEHWKARQNSWRNLFTQDALDAIENATQAAYSLKHDCVGAEHLLAGLLKVNHGSVPKLLKSSGIDLPALRKEIEAARGQVSGEDAAWPKSYTPRFTRIMEAAKEEAVIHGDGRVDTGHLFLGLLREGDGLPASVLKKFHVDPEQARLAVLQEMKA